MSSVTTDSPFGITRSYSPRLGTEPVEVSAPVAKDFTAIFNKVIAASEIVFKSPVQKNQKNWQPDWTATDLNRTAVAVQALW